MILYSLRFLQLRYGEAAIKRAVPLALGLISVSNPKLQILDTLSKFSHDSDPEVAHNAILAMGIAGAGGSYWYTTCQDKREHFHVFLVIGNLEVCFLVHYLERLSSSMTYI